MSLADQSLQWYPTSVQVTVFQARSLRIKGKNGTNDAYAIMQVAKDKFATSVVEKTVSPIWKEEATFDLPLFHHSNTECCTLNVQVMHRALVGPDKLLGQAVINLLVLSEIKSRNKTEWFKLVDKAGKADKERGEVLVDIQFMRNNMTASMLDLSASDKPRSRLGRFKDKVRGKKKEGLSDSASAVVPSFTQVLTDSEGEENGDRDADKEEKRKKHKLKSLFSPKSNLQRNMSQSMSVLGPLPERNSSLSGSRSSGLNIDSSEGKKKFKFLTHKRTGSSDSKSSQGSVSLLGRSKQSPASGADQSNLCINGSHVYTEEVQPRSARAGSTFSLASSGHGSMEDLRRSQGRKSSIDSLRAVKQPSLWEEENSRADLEQEEKVQLEQDRKSVEEQQNEQLETEKERRDTEEELKQKRREEVEKRMRELEEEERRRSVEQERRKLEDEQRREEERRKFEEEERTRREKQAEEIRIKDQERQRLNEENSRIEEEERIRKEEERIRKEEERMRKKEQERRRVVEDEERVRLEEEKRAVEEKNKRLEEERRVRQEHQEEEKRKILEQERLYEEKKKKEEEEQLKQEEKLREEMERKNEEEQRIRREEIEKRRKEEVEYALRQEEEERKKRDVEERIRREEDMLRKAAEDRKRKEEEERVRKEEEESRREEEERKIRDIEEKLRIEEERKRTEEKERVKREEEDRVRVEEEERKTREQERLDREMEDKRREEREIIIRLEKERSQNEERIRLEEKSRKEQEENMRVEEQKRKLMEEQERISMDEERRQEEILREAEGVSMDGERRQEEILGEEEGVTMDEERRQKEIIREAERVSMDGERRQEEIIREAERVSMDGERRQEEILREEERTMNEEEGEKRRQEAEQIGLAEIDKLTDREETEGKALVGEKRFEDDRFEDGSSPNYFEETSASTASSSEPLSRTARVSSVRPSSTPCTIPAQPLVSPSLSLAPSEPEGSENPPAGKEGTNTSQDPLTNLMEKKRRAPLPPNNMCMGNPNLATARPAQAKPTELTLTNHSVMPFEGKKEYVLSKDVRVFLNGQDRSSALQDQRPALQAQGSLKGMTRDQDQTQKEPSRTTKILSNSKKPGNKIDSDSGTLSQQVEQMIAPLKASSAATAGTAAGGCGSQGFHHGNQNLDYTDIPSVSGFQVAKHNKGPAPSRPNFSSPSDKTVTKDYDGNDIGNPTSVQKHSLALVKEPKMPQKEDSQTTETPVVSELNPFVGSGIENQSVELCDNQEGLHSHNQSSFSTNEDVTLSKSLKTFRAPKPPVKLSESACNRNMDNTPSRGPLTSGSDVKKQSSGVGVEQPVETIPQAPCVSPSLTLNSSSCSESLKGSFDRKAGPNQPASGQGTVPQVRPQPCETRPLEAYSGGGEEAEGKGDKRASTSRRPHPVRPFGSLEPHSAPSIQSGQLDKSAVIPGNFQLKTKKSGMKGLYSQLTQEELISLVVKQQKQLVDRDKKIAELEQYIDNLLVRVIEEAPCILMSLNSPLK